ncbi:MAG TPA: hypothetical protein V6D22_06510 [Candidatus Obscuribacterales bacterium]
MSNHPNHKKPMNSALFFVLSFFCMAIPTALIFYAARHSLQPIAGRPPGEDMPTLFAVLNAGIAIVFAGGIALVAGMLTLVRALINRASTPKFKGD